VEMTRIELVSRSFVKINLQTYSVLILNIKCETDKNLNIRASKLLDNYFETKIIIYLAVYNTLFYLARISKKNGIRQMLMQVS